MIDEFEKYIDKRINQSNDKLKFYEKDDIRYKIYKGIIMELQIVKTHIKTKKSKEKFKNEKSKT